MWLSSVGLIIALAFSLLVIPRVTGAQKPTKVLLIGVLGTGFPPSEAQRQQSPFLQKLRELGWREGYNIAFERRDAEGKLDRLPDLAADLVRRKPDVLVVGGTQAVRAAQQATTTIPIVLTGAGFLVEQGIVASLARPGGNITGVENNPLGLSGKRLALLKEALPQVARVAFLFNPTNPFFHLEIPRVETDARALGLQLESVAARHAGEFNAAFATIVKHRPDALFIGDDALFSISTHLAQIIDFAASQRLPTLGARRLFAVAGSLIAYGYSERELAQQAAIYVDKILRGARPGDLPIARPTKFELIINLKAAKTLGLTIPPTVLVQADEVIQ